MKEEIGEWYDYEDKKGNYRGEWAVFENGKGGYTYSAHTNDCDMSGSNPDYATPEEAREGAIANIDMDFDNEEEDEL